MTVRQLVAALMCVPEEGWDCDVMMVPGRGSSRSLGSCTGVLGEGDIPGGPGCEDVTGWYLLIQENSDDSMQEDDEDGM